MSYGASTVTRTSGRGHVAEAKTNVIEVSGFSIRVSKRTLLTLNVHFCVQLQAQRCGIPFTRGGDEDEGEDD